MYVLIRLFVYVLSWYLSLQLDPLPRFVQLTRLIACLILRTGGTHALYTRFWAPLQPVVLSMHSSVIDMYVTPSKSRVLFSFLFVLDPE